MKNIPIILYIVIGLLNVLGHYLNEPDLVRFTKPMLMPALLFYIYYTASGHVTLRVLLLCIAVVFSFLGDLALMKDTETFFLLGLTGFLLAQLTYTYLYYKSTFAKPAFRLMPLLPILTFTVFFLIILYPNVPGDMRIPIFVYALCITAMACMSRLRSGLTSENSYQWVMMGSLLFVVSDALIAYDKYYRSLSYDQELITATYIGAQRFIAMGILDHPEQQMKRKA
jgi:uncharacterized membrane protein YhhN